jgi:hypothetical protein
LADLERLILLPILNRAVKTVRGPVLGLGDKVTLRTISDAHFGTVFEQDDSYKDVVTPRTKCLYVSLDSGDDPDILIRRCTEMVRFTMNSFCEEGPLLFLCGFYIEQKLRAKILKTYNVPVRGERSELGRTRYRLRSGISAAELSTYYSTVETAVSRKPGLLLSLRRINLSLSNAEFEDQVVDLTMGLESLIPGKDELRFRFALYHSFITEPDPSKRQERFELLQTLYDVRSLIVHSAEESRAAEKKGTMIREQWDNLKTISISALNYYVLYLSSQDPAGWQRHLQSLVLSGARRVTETDGELNG